MSSTVTGLTPHSAADLSACDSEQIQHLGCIQPHGFLLQASTDWLVTRASRNLSAFLPIAAEDAIGLPVSEVLGRRATHDIRGQLQIAVSGHAVQHMFNARDDEGRSVFDVAVHRSDETVVIECERHDPSDEAVAASMLPLLMQLRAVETIDRLCSMAARQVRVLSGFDRVMAYRFHPDGSGEVIAETKRAELSPFKGLRYPATDIPAQARALYERNPIRIIADVGAMVVPIAPALDPSGAALDLSLSTLRAVSPIHLEYLRNMGVSASMSISILVGGKLWGLIACHHRTPRKLSLQRRSALEFFGQMVSTLVESLLRSEELSRQEAERALHTTILSAFSAESSTLDDLVPQFKRVQSMLSAHGFATFVDGRLRLSGETPTNEQTLELMQFLNTSAASKVYCTNALATAFPAASAYAETASGVLSVPISRHSRDHIVFFRRELRRQVTWAGEPTKIVSETESGPRISPRKSFAAWQETVRGHSAVWSDADRHVAEALRITLLEIMLQVTDRAERQRKRSNEQQDLLIAELNHRVRNILNLIVGLVRQCSEGATSTAELANEISARVHALARAHDQLTSSGWGARSVMTMIRVEAGAYLGERAGRVTLVGDDVLIRPNAFATIALVVHELITNAAKYGAFRDSHGMVEVQLNRDEAGGLVLDWREHGGAPVVGPTRRGFGSTIIERAIPYEFGGAAEIHFLPQGLHARFIIPADCLAELDEDHVQPSAIVEREPVSVNQIEGSVLLVEDNLLIALETEDALYALGADDVHIASTISTALDYLEESRPRFAVLDYNLGRESSLPIADRLAAMDVPFVFATGYGDTNVIEPRHRARPILTKPYTAQAILGAFNTVLEARAGA